jgi:hypothetical protein
MCVLAVLLTAGAACAALQDGDFLVLNENDEAAPTPWTVSLMNVKPEGAVETLLTFGPWEWVSGIAVYPDGSIIAAREGNYRGGPTPTPDGTGPGTPTPTPYPPNYWRESAILRVQPDGAVSVIALGGKLNPSVTWNDSIQKIGCDALGNIFVLNEDYQPPAPTPGPYQALLKVAPDGTVTEFASGGIMDEQWTLEPLGVSADGEVFMVQQLWTTPLVIPPAPTPLPARVIKADSAGALSVAATTSSQGGVPAPPLIAPPGSLLYWSEPFLGAWNLDFDFNGRLLVSGAYFDQIDLFSSSGTHTSIQAVNPDGTFATVVDGDTNGALVGQDGLCFDGQGMLVGATEAALYRLEEPSQISFIASGSPFVQIMDLKYYPSANPPFETWFSEALLAQGEDVAVGFDIARGRTNNTDDLYFGIQFPASAGGAIQLFNPNAASNGFPLLIPLELAQQYPAEVSKLRYGNATTTVRGGWSVELGSFPSVVGIPAGTYQFLGVMTEPGASLWDTSKWRTPGGQPVAAECVFIGTL